jgi:hypothetical protein
MRIIILLSLLTLSCVIIEKNKNKEEIIKIILNLNNTDEKAKFDNWVNTNIIDSPDDTIAIRYKSKSSLLDLGKCQYEDKNFEIYSSCGGEWGGFLYFVEKNNRDAIHYLPCTCLVMIDFRDNNYFITETLVHMSGTARISKLKNPKDLPIVVKNTELDNKPSKLYNIGEIILDTFDITANLFYSNHGRNYLIYSEYDTTYIGEVRNKRIISKEVLINHGIWSYGHQTNKIKNGIYISEINHISTSAGFETIPSTTEAVKGMIYFKQDTVVIGYAYSKK